MVEYTKRYKFVKHESKPIPETTDTTIVTDDRFKIELETYEIIRKYKFKPEAIPVLSIPLVYDDLTQSFKIGRYARQESMLMAYYYAVAPSPLTTTTVDYLRMDADRFLYVNIGGNDAGIVTKSDIPYSAAGNIQVAISESQIQVPADVQSVLANKYEQLLNADITVAQSITLDTEGLKLLEVYAESSAATNFYLDVSNDNTNWFTYYTWSAVTEVKQTMWNGFRYVRFRSDANTTVTSGTVTLVLAAKP